jgi:hypothetical protein
MIVGHTLVHRLVYLCSQSTRYFLFQYLIIPFSNVPFECETGQRVNETFVTDFSSTCPSVKKSHILTPSDGSKYRGEGDRDRKFSLCVCVCV